MTTSTALTTVTVTPTVNAANDSYSTAAGVPVNCPVLANDMVNGLPATLESISAVPQITVAPAHGTVEWDGTQFVYTPEEGYCGADTFEYEIARVCASCFCVTWWQRSGTNWNRSRIYFGMPEVFSTDADVRLTWSGGCIDFYFVNDLNPFYARWYARSPGAGCAGVTALPAEGEAITLTQGDATVVVHACAPQALYFTRSWVGTHGWGWGIAAGPWVTFPLGTEITVVHLGRTYTAVYNGNITWVGDEPPAPSTTNTLSPSDSIMVGEDEYCGGLVLLSTAPHAPDPDAPVFFSFVAGEGWGTGGYFYNPPDPAYEFGTLLPPGLTAHPGLTTLGAYDGGSGSGGFSFDGAAAASYGGYTAALYDGAGTLLTYAPLIAAGPASYFYASAAFASVGFVVGETYYVTLTPPPGP